MATLASLPPCAGKAANVMRNCAPQADTIMRGANWRPFSKAPRIDLPSRAICPAPPAALATWRMKPAKASANAVGACFGKSRTRFSLERVLFSPVHILRL